MTTILFLHGWHSVPGGVKPTYLKDHGHQVINPALDDDDFALALNTAQREFDKHQPEIVVGSSRGGAVAMNINSGDAKLVLLCPAWKNWGTAKTVIIARFPRQIDTYYEPFVGSGAVLFRLLSSDIKVQRFRCSDLCKPLIDLWNTVIRDPRLLACRYEEMWHGLKERGRPYYEEVRSRFNQTGDPCDIFFLLRTCRIGLVRFNQRGHFMVSYHLGQNGLPPEPAKRIINEWHQRLRSHDVQFTMRDYNTVKSKPGDFLYLDPPYKMQKCRLYFGRFDHAQLFDWLGKQKGGYALSLNGFI